MKKLLTLTILLISLSVIGQQNKIKIKSVLIPETDELLIQQELLFINHTDSTFNNIYLHNWANSFENRKTPLSKRYIKNFKKELYFAKKENLGSSKINNLSIDFDEINFEVLKNQQDIIKIPLNTPLVPKDSITISASYKVKIPNAKFTKYGKTNKGYNLRYWYLTPAVYQNVGI